jgi:hypothetical protein
MSSSLPFSSLHISSTSRLKLIQLTPSCVENWVLLACVYLTRSACLTSCDRYLSVQHYLFRWPNSSSLYQTSPRTTEGHLTLGSFPCICMGSCPDHFLRLPPTWRDNGSFSFIFRSSLSCSLFYSVCLFLQLFLLLMIQFSILFNTLCDGSCSVSF